jgi:two-component sensor histidine kinase
LSREALGHLTIKWRNNAEGGFQFDWREKGSNRDCDQNPNGFGNVIVKALVEKQLGGRLVREWRKDGLAVWISLPTKSGAG